MMQSTRHFPLLLVPMAGWILGNTPFACHQLTVDAFVPISPTSQSAISSLFRSTTTHTRKKTLASSSRLFAWNGARTNNQVANEENNDSDSRGNNKRMDLYQILGVRRDAQTAEIKAAYRQMAKKYHPDANKATDTTELFKEINRAYQTLSDPEARKNYNIYGVDKTGHQAPEATVDNPYASGGFSEDVSMDDIWDSFYGKQQRAQSQQQEQASSWAKKNPSTQWWDSRNNAQTPRQPTPDGSDPTNGNNRKHGFRSGPVIGDDVRMDIEIDFGTAVNGGQHILEIQHYQRCTACEGTGEGGGSVDCPHCGGKGTKVHNPDMATAFQRQEAQCKHCQGTGKIHIDHCQACMGEGRVLQTKQVKVTIPAGVEDGSRLLVCGEGHVGPRGGPPGDLYLYLNVKLQEGLTREGADIRSTETISFVDAILGSTITSSTVNGDVAIDIPAGTQPGHVIRIKGMGAPRSMNQPSVRGDHFVTIHVEIPTELTSEQQQMMQQMKTGDVTGFTATAATSSVASNLFEAQLAAEKEAREEAMEQYTRLKVEFDAQRAEAERINKAWKDESETFSRLLRETRAELAANHESAEANMSVLLNQISELQTTNDRLNKDLESSAGSTVGKELYEHEKATRERAEREMQLLRQRLQQSDQQIKAMQQNLRDTKRHFETQLNNALSHQRAERTNLQAQSSVDQERFEQMKKNYEAMAANYQAMESERETFKNAVEDLEKQLQIAKDNMGIRHANEEAAKQAVKSLQEEIEALRQAAGGDAALEAERLARESAEKEIKRLQAELEFLHEQAEIEKQLQPEGSLVSPAGADDGDLVGADPSDLAEVEQLKEALTVALAELENTRTVLREAIARVDASDLRSGKLELELTSLKADLQVVAGMMEEMRTTSQFTQQSAPYYAQYNNGQSNGRHVAYHNGHSNGSHAPSASNGYHANGYTDSNGNMRRVWPFGSPSNGRPHM